MGVLRYIVLFAAVSCITLAGDDMPVKFTEKPSNGPKMYGNATVDKIIDVLPGYVFRCDIKGWPAIIGEDIPIRISGVAIPQSAETGVKPTDFFQEKLAAFIDDVFAKADKDQIRLKKIRRGKSFSLVADVYIGDIRLSEMLIEKGLARRYAGKVLKIEVPIVEAVEIVELMKSAEPKTISASYAASKSSKVFHRDTCRFARSLTENKKTTFATAQAAAATGRRPCKTCKP